VAVGLVADLADCLAACNDRQLRDLYLHNLLVLVQVYNNAARFLRLSEAEIARHHGR
jgi:hypothetical protein